MNLGGIVWTEKIKTGKEQPDINNTYSESDDEALGGVIVRLLDEMIKLQQQQKLQKRWTRGNLSKQFRKRRHSKIKTRSIFIHKIR